MNNNDEYGVLLWIIGLFRQEFEATGQKTPYESCVVKFKDKLNTIKLYNALCISNQNISESCIQAILNYGVEIHIKTTKKISLLIVPFTTELYLRYL